MRLLKDGLSLTDYRFILGSRLELKGYLGAQPSGGFESELDERVRCDCVLTGRDNRSS